MKKIMFSFALLIILGTFIACENSGNTNDFTGSAPKNPPGYDGLPQLNFSTPKYIHTQYIRTVWGTEVPSISVLTSKNELDRFYNNYHDSLNFDSHPDIILYSPEGFTETIGKYKDDFFLQKFLVIVFANENSGSIRHEVAGVYANGDIVIRRLIPELGDTEMAQWCIIIELDNKDKLEEFRAVFIMEQL